MRSVHEGTLGQRHLQSQHRSMRSFAYLKHKHIELAAASTSSEYLSTRVEATTHGRIENVYEASSVLAWLRSQTRFRLFPRSGLE